MKFQKSIVVLLALTTFSPVSWAQRNSGGSGHDSSPAASTSDNSFRENSRPSGTPSSVDRGSRSNSVDSNSQGSNSNNNSMPSSSDTNSRGSDSPANSQAPTTATLHFPAAGAGTSTLRHEPTTAPRFVRQAVPARQQQASHSAAASTIMVNTPQAAQADLFLTQKIRQDLLNRDPAAVRAVNIITTNGVVYLRGQVPTPADKDMVYGIARGHAQNLPVQNELSIRR